MSGTRRENNAKVNWDAPKLSAAMASLPDDLKPHFKQLVEDITFSCFGKGAPIRNWAVLSQLVRDGWRKEISYEIETGEGRRSK